jgi:hypothetical protein
VRSLTQQNWQVTFYYKIVGVKHKITPDLKQQHEVFELFIQELKNNVCEG